MADAAKLLVVYWEWGPETKHAGARFWVAHDTDIDDRITDWPNEGLVPLSASEATVTFGEGLDLLLPIASRTASRRSENNSQMPPVADALRWEHPTVSDRG